MYKILTLNDISEAGLKRLPVDHFEVASDLENPDAILLRSYNMHYFPIPDSLKAVGRAGAGVNNIPIDKLSNIGVPVFNAPGANANAVMELVIGSMFLSARNICQAWSYVCELEGSDEAIHGFVEAGKKKFVGFELPGKTLGVIGMGAVGVKVANTALDLGMEVYGYDPDITVKRAWQLSSRVEQATSIDDLLSKADFVTFHVPLINETKHMIDAARLKIMPDGVTLLNFSRDGIVDNEAVSEAIKAGKVRAYICDFPNNLLKGHERVITLPHIGASTVEAEENCAIMVADQVRDWLENGNVHNSVNFPEVSMSRTEGYRIAVANANVPNMVGQISTTLANHSLNIIDMVNMSRGELAYTLLDVNEMPATEMIEEIRVIDGVLAVRTL